MRLSTGSTKSGQLCSWPGLALWGLCSWERHVSQKRREKKKEDEEAGEGRREDTERVEKKGGKKGALGYFELITHSSMSSSKASTSYEKNIPGLSWIMPCKYGNSLLEFYFLLS